MRPQLKNRSLGAFLKALRAEGIECILIGNMAAIRQGAPLMTVDYDFWVHLPVRAYVRLLTIVQRLGGIIRSQTVYELNDGTQIDVIFEPHGLKSFEAEWKNCQIGKMGGVTVRVLPLNRIISSKRASGREKDLVALPVLERTQRLAKRATKGGKPARRS